MRAFTRLVLLLVVMALILLFPFSATPVVTLPASLNTIGQATPVTASIADPHGIRHAVAYIEQNGVRYKLADVEHPARRFRWLRGVPDHTLKFTAGVKSTRELKDGSARLMV